MPQMMPLNWLSMLMSMNFMLLIFSVVMFNLTLPSYSNKRSISTTMISNKWMW